MFKYTFIGLILTRKLIKITNYIINKSTIASLERKLINTTKNIFNMQYLVTSKPLLLGCLCDS